ncbi:MazG nucleotide pyrophosphohydrolase domain-containing protein [Natronobacterium gregoryi]|uniref:Nucleotide pyrophosphohydrolase n=2 Tax=Natronobacterium gregoryi TaxID=44930 RepID=L0AFG7_NATGS|nr:MazG nucleotide pyrophosphohydrolase domain-containing protein [Natronobacterium gregoryi]AFZ72581.1 putative pyrophosphatase [Natronobacterium gregoryi SP2]ELY71900.1 nucleotide pyrophosphohydrolase [Natronobacterium gregoryi SP2]PLK19338.1 nucleotide pyrophosphohydrolase [Natronobacterium gregoryi SP2]SFJ52487.1 NTP pyrophosphatase, house-cleaning of non-canonical NTPs [Natronobacterium gregoryi]
MDDAQRQVAAFVEEYGLETPPAFRLLDLVSEVGELAKDANVSTDYGDDPAALELSSDEVGDALFALLALADDLEIDADAALEEALEKYEQRMDGGSDAPGSGR